MENTKTVLLAVAILFSCDIGVAQFKSQLSSHIEIRNDLLLQAEQPQPEEKMGFWPKFGYLMLAHGIYSTVDVIVYPIVSAQQNNPRRSVPVYRVGQLLLEVGLGRLLTKITGDAKVEIAFHIQHWTWLDDFMYYPMYDALHGTNAYRDEVSAGRVTWAGWTPVGLYRWSQGRQLEPIDERTLIIQGAVGFSVGVVLVLL